MRNALISIVIIGMAVVVGCITIRGNKYASSHNISQIQAVKNTMVVIETRGKVVRYSQERDYEMEGISIAIGDGLLLAETHATKIPERKIIRGPFGYIMMEQEVLEEKFYVADVEVKLVGRHKDISLFQAPFSERYAPIPIGNSDDLDIGTDILVVGWSFGRGINVKGGIVSRFVVSSLYDPPGGTIKDISFMISAPVNPGDSGSPVLAWNNHSRRYEIVGLVCSMIRDHGLGFAYTSNFVLEAISKIKEAVNVS